MTCRACNGTGRYFANGYARTCACGAGRNPINIAKNAREDRGYPLSGDPDYDDALRPIDDFLIAHDTWTVALTYSVDHGLFFASLGPEDEDGEPVTHAVAFGETSEAALDNVVERALALEAVAKPKH